MKFVSIDRLAPEAWDDLVRRSPDGWCWGTHAWQRLVVDVPRWRFQECGFGVELDGRLVAVVPLHFQPDVRYLASSGWGLTGPILAPGLPSRLERRIMAGIFEECRHIGAERGALWLEAGMRTATQRSLASRWGVNPLVFFGFTDESQHSKVINLRLDEERLWADLSDKARQPIRKARREGYSVQRVEWREMLDIYYDIHCETYTRTGVPPHPREYFSGIADRMAPAGYNTLWAGVAPDGEIVAFHNTARFQNVGYYHTGCCRTAPLASGVNYLLVWSAILGLRQENGTWYEVGEVFPGVTAGKEYGLSLIKSRFGGEVHRSFRGKFSL